MTGKYRPCVLASTGFPGQVLVFPSTNGTVSGGAPQFYDTPYIFLPLDEKKVARALRKVQRWCDQQPPIDAAIEDATCFAARYRSAP